jgi:hypothetical protein
VLPNGDSASVSLVAAESTGDPVVDGTWVTVTASFGNLCVPMSDDAYAGERCTETTTPPVSAISVKTTNGIARVRFRSGPSSGQVTLTARSGTATATATLTVSNQVAPAGAKFLFAITPDSVGPSGGTAQVLLFVASGSTPVPDGTVVVLSATTGTINPTVGLTVNGLISATFKSGTAGAAFVRASSGASRDSAMVTVK